MILMLISILQVIPKLVTEPESGKALLSYPINTSYSTKKSREEDVTES